MADSTSQYGSDLNKLIIELQYRVGALEGEMADVQNFVQDQSNTAIPSGTGVAGKYAKWVSDALLGTATVLQESGSTLTVSGDIVSDANNTRDIGTPSNFFANTYSINVAAHAVATDLLGDATAGFIELEDVDLRLATSLSADLGASSKLFGNVWAGQVNTDKLSDAGGGFVEVEDVNLVLKTDVSATLGSASIKWLAAYMSTLHADNLTTVSGSGAISVFNDANFSSGKVLGVEKVLLQAGTNGVFVTRGAGTPEGSVPGDVGALYVNTTGAASTTFYVKESSPTATTGWIPYGAAGGAGANTSLSNLVTPPSFTSINADLIPQGDGTAAGHNLGTNTGPHHWNNLYIVSLINTGTGNIDVTSNLRPSAANSYALGDSTLPWSDVWLSQYPSRIYFKQAGLTPSISAGTGSPNTAVSAAISSLFLQSDGAPGSQLWVKTSGTGATTWTAINPAGTSPPGSDQQIIYNQTGGFQADANLAWDYTNHIFSVGGSGAIIFTSGQFQAPNGTAAAPGYAFHHATDGPGMGLFWQATNSLGIATSGTEQWRIDSNGILKAVQNNLDIGQNGLFRPRDIWLSRTMNAATSVLTPYVGTQLIDSNTSHTSPVTIADTIQPDFPNARNCASNGVEWANVYSFAYRLASGGVGPVSGQLSWTASASAPTGTPTRGSIHSRTSGGGPFYAYDGSTWIDLTAAASGANTTLSNLSQTLGVSNVAVNTDLLPDASGNNRLLGTSAKTWGQCWINTVNTNNLSTLAGPGVGAIIARNDINPLSDLNSSLGTGSLRFSQVGTSQITWTASGVLDEAGSSIGAPSFAAPNGSVFRRTNGTTSQTLYVREAGVWNPVQTGGAGAFADQQLSNLTGTTSIPISLIAQSAGIANLGSSGIPWGAVYGQNGHFDFLTTVNGSGSITASNTILPVSPGSRNLGSAGQYWGSLFTTNVAVTNIVPNTSVSTFLAIQNGSTNKILLNNSTALSSASSVQIYVDGALRTLTTSGGTPLFVV